MVLPESWVANVPAQVINAVAADVAFDSTLPMCTGGRFYAGCWISLVTPPIPWHDEVAGPDSPASALGSFLVRDEICRISPVSHGTYKDDETAAAARKLAEATKAERKGRRAGVEKVVEEDNPTRNARRKTAKDMLDDAPSKGPANLDDEIIF